MFQILVLSRMKYYNMLIRLHFIFIKYFIFNLNPNYDLFKMYFMFDHQVNMENNKP